MYEYCENEMINSFNANELKQLNMKVDNDLIQMGYLHVVEGTKHYNPSKSSFSTFIYRFLTSRFLNYIRNNQADKRKSNLDNLSLHKEIDSDEGKSLFLDLLQDEKTNVEKQVITKITLEQLYESLSEKQKEVIILRSLGYGNVEIAKKLSVSHTAIKDRWNLALRKMREKGYENSIQG